MTVGILLYGLAGGALATLVGWALATVFRMAGQPERWAWAGALLLAALVNLLPFVPLPAGAAAAGAAGTFRAREIDPSVVAGPVSRAEVSAFPVVDLDQPVPAGGAVWLALSALLVALGLGAELRHRRRTGRLRKARLRGLDVWMSEREGPAICGALPPRLVLPERIRELDARDRALILTHEAEHLRARDPQLNALAILVLVAVPWNPFLWILRRSLVRAVESDCDHRALRRRGVGPRRYVEVMLRVASWDVAAPSVPLRLAMGRSARDLRDRIERVLRPDPPRRSGALAGVLLLAAGASAPLFANPPEPLREPTGVVVASGTILRAEQVARGEDALALGQPPGPSGDGLDPAKGAFRLETTDDGSVTRVSTEALEGTEAFETAAAGWLLAGRVGDTPGSAGEPVRVWVSVDDRGRWSAARVSPDLYEREGLARDPERVLDLIDLWRRLDTRILGEIPTVSSMRTRLDSTSPATATFRERR